MSEETIVISNRELVDYTVLTRKKNEEEFRRDFLLRSGAKPEDLHLKAVTDLIGEIEGRLAPVRAKLEVVDLVTIVPKRKEIEAVTEEINRFSKQERDDAVMKKSGPVYDLMRKRAALTKGNYERREDIARLTVLANSLPRRDCEALCRMVEELEGEAVDAGTLSEGKRREMATLANRLGCPLRADGSRLVKESKPLEASESEKTIIGKGSVWVPNEKLDEFEKNEQRIAAIGRQMQERTAQRQVRVFGVDEQRQFDELQRQYIEALNARATFLSQQDEKVTMRRRSDDGIAPL